MYSTKDGKFILLALAMCTLGYRVSSWETCPVYIPHYCACEITDQPQLTLINMCTYEIEEGVGCKPCPPDFQDYANCTSCPGKTCPVCAPDEYDMLSLQRSVSLDTYEDLKKIGQITTSYSFKLAQNSSIINKTDEDESTRTRNATEDDQNKDEEMISEGNQPLKSSNTIIEDQSGSQQNFSDENQTTRSLNNIEEDPYRNGENFYEKNQTSRNENTAEEDQNSSEWESSEQDGNTTDQYFSDEDYGSEKINNIGLKEKDGSVEGSIKQKQRNKTSHDQKFEIESNLNDSLNYTTDRLISEKYGNDSYKEYDKDEMFTEDEIMNSTSETERDSTAPEEYISGKAEVRLDLKSSTTDQLSPLETANSESYVSAYDTDSRKIMDVPKTTQSDVSEKKSRETDILTEAQRKGYINDDKNLKLNKSDEKNVKIWFSGERYPSEQNVPDVETFEDNRDTSIGMNESFSSLPDQAFRQPYLLTGIPDEEFKGEKVHSREDIKPSDTRSLLMKTEQSSDNFESTNSSTSIKQTPKYNDGSLVNDTLNGRTLNPIIFTLSSQPGEVYFLRGENSKNDSLSENSFYNGYADKLEFENTSSELENNNSSNFLSDDINSKMTIEKEDKLRSVHLNRAVDKSFSKNNYVKDVINHVFYDESNSAIQTLAFDVIFVNYLKYSTGMPDLTTFYFSADLSPEEKLDINLVRICFLNQNFSTVTADDLNLCRKDMASIPESSSLLTVRVQNSYIFKEFLYNTFDEENEHTDKNQTLLDRSSLSPNERESGIFNGYDYKFLRKEAEKFVQDSFDFRKLYDLWITPQNESSETFRFCHDINKVRVCKNYENGTRIHMKIDDRFHIFVSAFLDSATLFDMHAAQFIQMQHSKHSYIMSNTNAESGGKKETYRNKQFITFPETGLSTASNGENAVDGNKSLEIIEDRSGESSGNLTEESQYDFESEKALRSYSNANENVDTNMSKTSEGMNLSSSEDSIYSNFSDEIGDTEKDSFTRVNDTTEEVPSEENGSVTDDIQENESELEQDEGSTRFRRAANSTKHSPDDWCDYTKRTFNGSITCYQWTYKKDCTIHCYPGYDYAGEKSKQFTCHRKNNVWVPELTPCLKGFGFTNINEDLGLDSDIDENMKSHKEAKDEDAYVAAKVSTDGFKEKSHNLLSNYHANDFNFDNYAYDKYNYDSPSDEYE